MKKVLVILLALLLAFASAGALAECAHEDRELVRELSSTYTVYIPDANGTTCTRIYYDRAEYYCNDCGKHVEIKTESSRDTKNHFFYVVTPGEPGECIFCATPCPHETFADGACTVCQWTCPHDTHEAGLLQDVRKCAVCGKSCPHESCPDGTCGECGIRCPHWHYTTGKEYSVCSACGNEKCYHDSFSLSSYECTECGYVCTEHEYESVGSAGKCRCGKYCYHGSGYTDYKCNVCAIPCDHENSDYWYIFSSGYCADCGMPCPHTSFSDNECDECGYICPHEEYDAVAGECKVCKKICAHGWRVNGVCQVCGNVCLHSDALVYQETIEKTFYTCLCDTTSDYLADTHHREEVWTCYVYACNICGTGEIKKAQLKSSGAVKHAYDGQTCWICKHTCEHKNFTDEVCNGCGYVCPHEEYYANACMLCGKKANHKFVSGVCSECSYVCPHPAGYYYGVCESCGMKCSHPSYENGKCIDCEGLQMKITAQPKDVKVAENAYAKTSVKSTGEGLTYQWYYNDPGTYLWAKGTCTTANYSVRMTQARDGRLIYCKVTDKYGNSVSSDTVTLTMAAPITITTQPKNQSTAIGSSAKTSVKATGEGTLKYQWYYKDPGQSGFTKGTCTSANYSVSMTAARDGRQIYCEITDSYGQKKQTNTVTLDGYPKLAITTQPKGGEFAYGTSAKTNVVAEGEGLTYQWYYKDPGQSSFTKGTCTSANYSVSMTEARNGRQIYCQIKDSHGNSVKTNTVTLKGYTKLAITTQPSGGEFAFGTSAKTSVAAKGEGTLTYQWYYKDPGQSDFTKGTCTSADYSVSMTEARNGRQIYCQIKDSRTSIKTSTVTLKGYTALKITTQPKGGEFAFGTSAKTSVAAKGEGTLTYQWYYKDPGQSGFTKGTCTSANYSVSMTEARDGRQIYCEIKDSRTSIKTNTVTLKGYTALKITTQPKGGEFAFGTSAKTSVKAVGEGTLTYQWYYKDPGQSGFTKGTCTSANYSVSMTEARDGRQIYCEIKDSRTSIKTNTVTLKGYTALKITTQPKGQTVAIGASAKTSVKAVGEGTLTYQWYYKDPGQSGFTKGTCTSANYSVKMTEARNGRQIYCKITDDRTSIKTNTVTLKAE